MTSWCSPGTRAASRSGTSPTRTTRSELDYFERGAVSAASLVLGGTWSAYYYNGYVYSSDITKGLDVLKLKDPSLKKATGVRLDQLNPQSQPVYPTR